jgi:predicted transcriptional regulator
MSWFFRKKVDKTEFEQLKHAVQTGLNSAKQDVNSLGTWVKYLDRSDSKLKEEIFELNEELATVKSELEDLKNVLSIVGKGQMFKQQQTVFNKQTAVSPVLNSVQTAVQTAFLDNLSVTERAIIFILVNSDMKLSYEDLAAMLGKKKSTIRGQINAIRQKNEGLIEEQMGENNKKRVFIPDKIKEMLLKSGKVRVKNKKNNEKNSEKE